MMISHVHYTAYDPAEPVPASASYNVITKLLQTKLGFEGLIVSDDLEMGGFRKAEGLSSGIRKALHAGVDMFLVSNTLQHQLDTVNFLKEAVNTGEIHLSRIERSVDKIVAMKYDFFNRDIRIRREPGSKLSLGLSKKLFDESVKVVKKTRGYLPIKSKKLQYVYPNLDHLKEVGREFSFPKPFADAVKKKRIKAAAIEYPFEPTIADIEGIVEKLNPELPVVLFSFRQEFSASRKRLYDALVKSFDVIQIAVSDPYDSHSKSVVYITTFGYHDLAIEALARRLF